MGEKGLEDKGEGDGTAEGTRVKENESAPEPVIERRDTTDQPSTEQTNAPKIPTKTPSDNVASNPTTSIRQSQQNRDQVDY